MTDTVARISACDHDFVMTYSDYEKESYECSKCGKRHSLYYEDMS